MATYTRQIIASFGKGLTGKTTTYSVTSASGTVRIASTATGVSESPAGSGTYIAAPSFDDSWGPGRIEWVCNTTSFASEEFGSDIVLLTNGTGTGQIILTAGQVTASNAGGGATIEFNVNTVQDTLG